VLAHADAADAAGEALDELLLRHFAAEIEARHGVDALASVRSAERLLRRVAEAVRE